MARPRSQQISLDTSAYYHCIGRCVRRAFLCGEDALTGRSFEHRRVWMVERLALLTDVFAIDLYAYAVMANHYHLVVRINPARADGWSYQDIAQRWLRLFTGPRCVHEWLKGGELDPGTQQQALAEIAKWRHRLADLSWFMRCLNEHIARRANEEDHCTGHFWEGRFKVHALRDEASVLRCMAYVDLNPVRAGLASVPEEGDYTSYQQRCRNLGAGPPEPVTGAAAAVTRTAEDINASPEPALPHLVELGEPAVEQCQASVCPIRLVALPDYLELVDWTGRAEHSTKKHAIPHAAGVMQRLNLDSTNWLALMRPRRATVRKLADYRPSTDAHKLIPR